MSAHAGHSENRSNTVHTNPNTIATRFPPCRKAHIHSAQNTPPDSCRVMVRRLDHSYAQRQGHRRNHQVTRDNHSNWPDSKKSCSPTETAARSTRPALPSPTPPPSATGSQRSSSHCHWRSLYVRCDTPPSVSRPCNKPASAPPPRSAHCTTSRNHSSQSSAPDDSPPSRNRHFQTNSRGRWPSCRPAAIGPASRPSCPCRRTKQTRCERARPSGHPDCRPSKTNRRE